MTGQRLEPDRAVLACRVVDPGDRWCRRCGCEGSARDTWSAGWRTSRSGGVRPRWRSRSADTGARLRAGVAAGHQRGGRAEGEAVPAAVRWALEALVVQHLTVAGQGSPRALAVAWDTANDAVLAEGRRVLIGDPDRFDGGDRDRGG